MQLVNMSALNFNPQSNRVRISRNSHPAERIYHPTMQSVGRIARAMKTLGAKKMKRGRQIIYLFDPQ